MTTDMKTNLSKYENILRQAQANYARVSPRELKEILTMYYGEDYKDKVPKAVLSCGHCKIKELKKIGEDYFKS